ncbi:MAG TPA: TonB family protein [Casimicrobiaceae bacterium]|jgi:protein TonB|nr:TonB family protein [Casimicrobiaceae bacterium]
MPAKSARKRTASAPGTAAHKPAKRPAARAVPIAEPRTLSLPFVVADNVRGDQLLTVAIAGSILLHTLVLALRFSPFDLSALDRNGPPLEVALVNAKSKTKPTKAEILAQANLDGGGNTEANRRAKTPLPVLPHATANSEFSVATQKVEQLEKQAKELMTQIRAANAVAPPVAQPTDAPDPADLPSSTERMQRTLEALRLEAQIAKEMDAYEKRPKRRFVGARAAEYRFARYVEDWRLKVERVGNLNYPEAARVRKLYGSLLLTVGIRADGSIESVAVDRTSGQKILDLAATRIVEMAAPYAPFPTDIKRDTDILYITRTWTFAPGDSLISQ